MINACTCACHTDPDWWYTKCCDHWSESVPGVEVRVESEEGEIGESMLEYNVLVRAFINKDGWVKNYEWKEKGEGEIAGQESILTLKEMLTSLGTEIGRSEPVQHCNTGRNCVSEVPMEECECHALK